MRKSVILAILFRPLGHFMVIFLESVFRPVSPSYAHLLVNFRLLVVVP